MLHHILGDRVEGRVSGQTLDRLADTYVGRPTVGFARDSPARDSASSFGSGTLVRYGSIAGILTCAHVVTAVKKQKVIGLLCNGGSETQIQGIKIECSALRSVVLKGDCDEEDGPDLGFLMLPAHTMNMMEALSSAIDLGQQRDRHDQRVTAKTYMEAATGMIGEWTSEPEVGPIITKVTFTSFLMGGEISPLDARGGYDRLLFTPGRIDNLPKSFEGMSGGGIWYLGLNGSEESGYEVEERRLMGIAYYQTADRRIVGHGRDSIYKRLLPMIEAMQ